MSPGVAARLAAVLGTVLATAAWPATPAEAPPDGADPDCALSVELPGLGWQALVLDGERYLGDGSWSLLVALGVRWAAQGDYLGWTPSVGLGARFWPGWWRLPLPGARGGLFAGLRLDGAWAHLRLRSGGGELTSAVAAASLRVGYRAVFWRHLEITVEAGPALSVGVDAAPWLVAVPRLGAAFGLTVGYLF